MPKFLEFDLLSGKIICEISSDSLPPANHSTGILQIDDNLNIDTSSYAVRDGQLVKLFETNAEKAEREKLRKELHEQTRKRLNSLIHQCVIAILDDNDHALQELRNEFKSLKAYL